MTNKTQRVPGMPVPDLVRDDGSGIQSMVMLVCSSKSLNLSYTKSIYPKADDSWHADSVIHAESLNLEPDVETYSESIVLFEAPNPPIHALLSFEAR